MGQVLQFDKGYAFIDKVDSNTFEIRLQEAIPATSFVILMFRIDETHRQVRFQQGLQNIQVFKDWLEKGGEFKSRHYIMHLSIDNGNRTISALNQRLASHEFVLNEDNYQEFLAKLEVEAE